MAFEQGLILAIIIAGFALVRIIRRFDLSQRVYLLVVGATVTLGLLGLVRDDRFLGTIAMALTVLTVVLPDVLEILARAAFGWGRVRLAVGAAGLRAMLMPGAGLERQQEILRGLALLQRQGVDAALNHFRDLAGDTEDGGELAIIHEQIVAMLFYGLRWNEGIAHYEGQFHPGYAAVRPALALGLLRAYGESGRLETAAGLLRALEEGPIGSDPRAVAMLSQARVTFLAYAGDADAVGQILREEHLGTLGMSRANGALLRGIAAARAGDAERARVELGRVPALASGPSDDRAVEASSVALSALNDGALDLAPEVRAYADVVASRVRRFLAGTPTLQRHGPLLTTPILIGVQVLGYLVVLTVGGGTGLAVLDFGGISPELWRAGAWGRIATAPFVHGDAIGLLLAAYAIWLGGPVIERLRGSATLGLVALASGAAGLLAALLLAPAAGAVLAGGNLLGFGVAFGALVLLLPPLSPGLARRSRRTLAIPLALVLIASTVASVPGFLALDLLPTGLTGAAVAGAFIVAVTPQGSAGWRRHAVLGALVLGLLGSGAAVAQVAREDVGSFFGEHRDHAREVGPVTFDVPSHVVVVDAGSYPGIRIPVYAGLLDSLAIRTGRLLQLVVVPDAPAQGPALAVLDPELLREASVVEHDGLPEDLPVSATGARHQIVRRNGEDVALVLERRLGETAVLLVAAPVTEPDEELALLATIWAEAQLTP